MFDVAPSELLLVVIVALVVVGPKDLPRLLRTAGQWVRRGRTMAAQFRAGFDQMMREAELEEERQRIAQAILPPAPAPETQSSAADEASLEGALSLQSPSSKPESSPSEAPQEPTILPPGPNQP